MIRIRRLASTVAVATGALLLAACSSSSTAVSPVLDQSNDVPFQKCGEVQCTGTLDGAAYEIVLPDKWNGTLLIYSHGYRNAAPIPPDFAPVSTAPEPAPGWSGGQKDVGEALLAQGYALAGSAYKSNGWAVADGVAAGQQLYDFFSANVAKPNRVYAWGDSLGGLITAQLAQQSPWVNGAAPLCGALAGVVPNFDLALDTTYAVKTLIYPDMQLTGYATYEDAVKTWQEAAKRVVAAAQDTAGGGTAKILYIGAVVDAPSQTFTYDGSTIQSKVKATVEALLTAVGFGTFGRYDVEQRFGGNISSNEETDYAQRISAADAEVIDAVTKGASAQYTSLMQAGQRIAPDQTAREKAQAEGGNPTGEIQQPTFTIHTAADPLVIVQNESFFKDRYLIAQQAGKVKADLVQTFTVAPATYPEATGAPFGAGHCNFTKETRIAVVDILNDWVRNGVTPAPAGLEKALPPDTTGFNPLFQPGPWPNPVAVTP
jgi:hypothetical protein